MPQPDSTIHLLTYTQVPDAIFDFWLPELTLSELRVLLYVTRRTFGFKKHADSISIHQIADGIVTASGKRLDRGTGLSESGVKKAIRGLEERGIVRKVLRTHAESGASLPSLFCLNMQGIEDAEMPAFSTERGGGGTGVTPGTSVTPGGAQAEPHGGHTGGPTRDSTQQTDSDKQEPKRRKKSGKKQDEDFERWWAMSARRGSKDAAYTEWRKILADNPGAKPQLFAGLQRSLRSRAWVETQIDHQGMHIPHEERYLKRGLWKADRSEPEFRDRQGRPLSDADLAEIYGKKPPTREQQESAQPEEQEPHIRELKAFYGRALGLDQDDPTYRQTVDTVRSAGVKDDRLTIGTPNSITMEALDKHSAALVSELGSKLGFRSVRIVLYDLQAYIAKQRSTG